MKAGWRHGSLRFSLLIPEQRNPICLRFSANAKHHKKQHSWPLGKYLNKRLVLAKGNVSLFYSPLLLLEASRVSPALIIDRGSDLRWLSFVWLEWAPCEADGYQDACKTVQERNMWTGSCLLWF